MPHQVEAINSNLGKQTKSTSRLSYDDVIDLVRYTSLADGEYDNLRALPKFSTIAAGLLKLDIPLESIVASFSTYGPDFAKVVDYFTVKFRVEILRILLCL